MTLGRQLLFGALAATFASSATSLAEPVGEQPQTVLTSGACERFGFRFYKQLAGESTFLAKRDQNIAISPLSLGSVLEVVRIGASGQGRKELDQLLANPASVNPVPVAKGEALKIPGVTLRIGNSLWLGKKIAVKPEFLKEADAEFGSVVFNIDFGQPGAAANRINTWISDNTENHIKDLVKPDDVKNSELVIANAVYFKGDWEAPFNEKFTSQEPFHLTSGHDVQASMMHRTGDYRYGEFDHVRALEIPYRDKAVSMLILLPESAAEIANLEGKLSTSWFSTLVASLTEGRIAVSLPRFSFQCEPPDCIGILKSLGIGAIFTPGSLQGISDNPLYVNLFKHRAWLKVNEKGTEAAAATVTGIVKAVAMKPKEFIADHPFIFIIRNNKDGTPWFIGRVSNPSEKGSD